jgi:hypothetical protein|tara:strand:- start:1083 stop:1349 length:267 start_codon:yes stop_codon:yes gene_type:complete
MSTVKRTAKWIKGQAEQIHDVLSGDFDKRMGSTVSQIAKRLKKGETPAQIKRSILKGNPFNPNVLIKGGESNIMLKNSGKSLPKTKGT